MISIKPPFSRTHRTLCVIAMVCLLTAFAGVIFVTAQNGENPPSPAASAQDPVTVAADPQARARIAENFGKLPLSFEINKGQIDQSVKFLSHGPGYDLFLTANEAVLRVPKPRAVQIDKAKEQAPAKGPATAKEAAPNKEPAAAKPDPDANVREGTVLRLKLLGTSVNPQVEGQEELPGKVNYFSGNDPEKWHSNIPTYRKAYFKDVYPGIDVVYYGNQQELEYDLIVAARANPKLIRFTVQGADKIRLDKSGRLLLTLKDGEVSLNKPVIYQLDKDGVRREVKGGYSITGNEIRFKLENFDSNQPLVIDPVLSYSTLLGSSGNESALGIAIDTTGNAYVTGTTDGTNFPTTAGAFKTTSASFFSSAFVSKLNATGTALIYSTYLTGNGQVTATGIAVDSSGNAHVTGQTSASNFPTVNGLKTTSNFFKTSDAAVSWNNRNSGLVGEVRAIAIAPSNANTIYVGSTDGVYRSIDGGTTWTKTLSTGLPTFTFLTAMAVSPTNASLIFAGSSSGFFKSTDGGNTWIQVSVSPQFFSNANSIVFDPSTPATIYVGQGNGVFKSTDSGSTWVAQNNFGVPGTPNIQVVAINPTTPQTIYAGSSSNGIFRSTNGGGIWSPINTGLGGSNPLNITSIAIDPSNTSTIYTGSGFGGVINKSTNGGTSWAPVTNGVPNNFFISAMVATSSAVYAASQNGGVIKTVNGGTLWTSANNGLWSGNVNTLVRHPSNASVLYAGTSTDTSRDAYVTKLNASGSGLLFSTLVGGGSEEDGNDIAVDGSGNIYVVGQTSSSNFPIVNAAQSTITTNCSKGFVTKLNPAVPSFVYSTFLGGNACDVVNSVAADASGNAYVTGTTSSSDFPTANAFQPELAGQFGNDAFVTKFTPAGAFVYSTYLGGSNFDGGFGIAADATGAAYVTGVTNSSNFPTQNPIQTKSGFNDDAFVTKINSNGSALVYSTFLGGSSTDSARAIAVDSALNVYVTGFTDSNEFPITQGALRTRSSMHKSIDSAVNWSNDNYGFVVNNFNSTCCIVIDPTQPSTVYVGTQNGVFKSTNGGRTWVPINSGLDILSIAALVIDPVTPSTLYVGTPGFGVYKSVDGGASWNRRVNGMTFTDIISLAIDPTAPNTLYAGFRGGSSNRIYKTTDGADGWTAIGNAPFLVADQLVIDPLNHTTLYVADSTSLGGVFKSTNSGVTWAGANVAQTGPFVRFVSVSPHTAGLVYAGSDLALFKSVNGGTSWTPVPNRRGKIVFDPVSSTTLYLLSTTTFPTTEGLFKSTDNGQTWLPMNKGLNSQVVTALAIDPSRPSTLHLATMAGGGSDAFVTKVNPAGNALVYSTLLGGPLDPNNFFGTGTQGLGIAVDGSGNAYVTGMTQIAAFPVSPNGVQPFLRGFQDAFIAKLTSSYIISGIVVDGGGQPVAGAEIVLNDGTSLLSVATESDGSYQFSRLRDGGNFTVSASKPHFTMAPPSQTFNNLKSDKVQNFTATATASAFHIISGKVTENGVGVSGVTVKLSGTQSGLRTTDSNGNYSFELAGGGNYTVTPSIVGFNFGPVSSTFNSLSAAQTANFTATRLSFVVTNANNHGTGSLRDAIINANATPGTDTITFNIPGAGVKTITLLVGLPAITDRVVINGTTQPGYAGSPLIEIDGTQIQNGNGLLINAGGSTVKGLAIGNFSGGSAIALNNCDNNVIQGNYIGVAPDGTTQRRNFHGIGLGTSSNNLIGGTTAAARNVIAGNTFQGILINGNGNTIQGNFIGTNASGTAAVLTSTGGAQSGVSIENATSTDNVIGGTAAGAGNLISGNQTGIINVGVRTTIQGNLIGTDITGTKKVPNSTGITTLGENSLVGGITAGARNIISGNNGEGVNIRGAGSKLQGNFIGTDITGTLALGNSSSGVVAGDALIGGTVAEARNIIAANGFNGNVSLGSFGSGSPATVQGNYIGTDVTGTKALSATSVGINISTNNNIIGGTTGPARNIISGNLHGISFGSFFSGVVGNVIQGNFIGLNATGTGPLPNVQIGILIGASSNNTIGGTQAGAGNRIAFNGSPGITVSTGTGNTIRGNSIFSNNGLGIDLGPNGVTANDSNDGDTGANQLQNFPVITTTMSTSSSTTIQGSLKSIPNTTFNIDFYSNAAVDPSGNGEGAQFFHTASVNTDGNGNANINVTVPTALASGRVITATATDPNGNTSEFSASNAAGAAGSVHFNVSSMAVIEDIGSATVLVRRSGGSTGSLTVQYATANGTAIAGQDYTAASGTLSFGAGETSKTIQIPITNDVPTEPDEAFTVALQVGSNLEALGAPNVLTVTIQDRVTVPTLSVFSQSVVEGNAGTTTQLFFVVSLSAATGRSVSADFATANFGAFGGKCTNQGADYETTTGTLSFEPGSTGFAIPVKVCGDASAEGDEGIRLLLSNVSGATVMFNPFLTGVIVNDDALTLALEESGPNPNQAAALDALLAVRDPFKLTIPEYYTGTDRNTRVALYARGLQLNPGESPSSVFVRLTHPSIFELFEPAEDVRPLPNSDLTQVVFRLPNNLQAGTYGVFIHAHGLVTNAGTIRIAP